MVSTFGLISDIHGDLVSLKTALGILQEQRVDTILCAGDLVEKGTDGDIVVQLIRDLLIPCVLGNHDEAAIGNQQWLRENADLNHPNVRGRLLAEQTLDYLRDLPRTLRFVWENQRVLLTHGTPKSNVTYLLPQSRPDMYKEIARQSEADVIIFGHTHIPTQAFFEAVWFFNPGSVCSDSTDAHRSCATLSLPDFTFCVFDLDTGGRIQVPFLR